MRYNIRKVKSGKTRRYLHTRNSIYMRCVNTNKGNTPRSLHTKFVSFNQFFHTTKNGIANRVPKEHIPYSISTFHLVNRVYRLKKNDYLFELSRNDEKEALLKLARSLDPTYVCGVELSLERVRYISYFRTSRTISVIRDTYPIEDLLIFKPGFYYCKGSWFFTPKEATSLYKVPNGSIYFNSHRNYYTCVDPSTLLLDEVTKDDLITDDIVYFIFIPLDKVETPILQAYLPMSMNIQHTVGNIITYPAIDVNIESNKDTFVQSFIWMGRKIQADKAAYKNKTTFLCRTLNNASFSFIRSGLIDYLSSLGITYTEGPEYYIGGLLSPDSDNTHLSYHGVDMGYYTFTGTLPYWYRPESEWNVYQETEPMEYIKVGVDGLIVPFNESDSIVLQAIAKAGDTYYITYSMEPVSYVNSFMSDLFVYPEYSTPLLKILNYCSSPIDTPYSIISTGYN